jgi:hypothetical protein
MELPNIEEPQLTPRLEEAKLQEAQRLSGRSIGS